MSVGFKNIASNRWIVDGTISFGGSRVGTNVEAPAPELVLLDLKRQAFTTQSSISPDGVSLATFCSRWDERDANSCVVSGSSSSDPAPSALWGDEPAVWDRYGWIGPKLGHCLSVLGFPPQDGGRF